MENKIKVLIADDILSTRENIRKLLAFHSDVEVVGEAGNAESAIENAKLFGPDIILMDINMPGMDGITATEIITNEMPNANIIMMSVQGEQEYLKRAMVAGAKNYLTKPFTGDELVQAIRQVYINGQKRKNVLKFEPKSNVEGRVITVFSTKGGIGKTTIATNLAVALADKAGAKVGIIDVDLQFGDVALFLNVMPQATIADLVNDIDNLDKDLLERYLTRFSDKVKLLSAPFRPEQAETINTGHLATVLKTMRSMFDYIIIDTAPAFTEVMLSILEASDQILVVAALDLPTIKNVKLCLEIMESLNYQDKLKMILNRECAEGGMDRAEVEETLGYQFAAVLPNDSKTVVGSVNRGLPFVLANPEAEVSNSIIKLAKDIANIEHEEKSEPMGMVHKLRKLFG